MSNLVRCIDPSGQLTCMAADTTAMVREARRIHQTSNVCTAALGRLLTAASFMGITLKGADHSVTLRMAGDGPAGSVIAVSDAKGNTRRAHVKGGLIHVAANNVQVISSHFEWQE